METYARRDLVDVTAGRKESDLIIKGGIIVNVYTRELLEGYVIGIKGKHISFVTNSKVPEGHSQVIDAGGRYIIPGFVDGHNHLDYLCSVPELMRYLIKDGTTTVITETSHIANALGFDGVQWFLNSLREQPIKVFATAPPFVSGNPNTQRGYTFENADIARLFNMSEIIGLGECSWTSVMDGDDKLFEVFELARSMGKVIEGHAAGAKGLKLNGFAASGVSSCHEAISLEDALQRLRLGLHTMIREGGIRSDLQAIAPIAKEKIDFRSLSLVSDGIEFNHLIEKGHMRYVVQKAIDLGFDPLVAIQMATINIATHFGLERDLGSIAPGKYADIIISPSLERIEPEYVISNGIVIAKDGKALVEPKAYHYPEEAKFRLKFPKTTPSDFVFKINQDKRKISVRVIHFLSDMVTQETRKELQVINGEVMSDSDEGILKVAALSTIHPSSKSVGFVSGYGLKNGACACSNTWDAANIVVIGDNDQDMAMAVNRLGELAGGFVFCSGGVIVEELQLPVGGLISEEPITTIAEKLKRITSALKRQGSLLVNPFLALQTLTFTGVPHLRINDLGVFSVRDNKLVDIIIE